MGINEADVAELVDARDLKSPAAPENAQHSCKTPASAPIETAANPAHLQNNFDDRLDKIEAMVTDLFRQLRDLRSRADDVRRALLTTNTVVGTVDRALGERIARVESLKPFIVAAHERLDAVDTWRNQTSARIDEMAEQKATITDAQQIHNRINRMTERFEHIRSATQHQQAAIKSVISAAKDQQELIAFHRDMIARLNTASAGHDTAFDEIDASQSIFLKQQASHSQRLAALEDVAKLHTTRINNLETTQASQDEAIDQISENAERRLKIIETTINSGWHRMTPAEASPPKRTIKGGWMNVYEAVGYADMTGPYSRRDLADDGAGRDRRRRLACIQIPDITEGEGL